MISLTYSLWHFLQWQNSIEFLYCSSAILTWFCINLQQINPGGSEWMRCVQNQILFLYRTLTWGIHDQLQGTLPLLQERGYQKPIRTCALAVPYLLFNQRTIVFRYVTQLWKKTIFQNVKEKEGSSSPIFWVPSKNRKEDANFDPIFSYNTCQFESSLRCRNKTSNMVQPTNYNNSVNLSIYVQKDEDFGSWQITYLFAPAIGCRLPPTQNWRVWVADPHMDDANAIA